MNNRLLNFRNIGRYWSVSARFSRINRSTMPRVPMPRRCVPIRACTASFASKKEHFLISDEILELSEHGARSEHARRPSNTVDEVVDDETQMFELNERLSESDPDPLSVEERALLEEWERSNADFDGPLGGVVNASSVASASGADRTAVMDADAVLNIAEVLEFVRENNALDVTHIDLTQRADWTDHFVIVTARSRRHMLSICNRFVETFKSRIHAAHGFYATIEGVDSDDWMCVDGGLVCIHVFSAHGRDTYDLDSIWQTAPTLAERAVEDQNLLSAMLADSTKQTAGGQRRTMLDRRHGRERNLSAGDDE